MSAALVIYRGPTCTCDVPPVDLRRMSVLVPCHNEGRVIAHTIGALQKLDYPAAKIEFLLINDGSTDDTAAVIRSFAADPRVRLLEVPVALSVAEIPHGARLTSLTVSASSDGGKTWPPLHVYPLVKHHM